MFQYICTHKYTHTNAIHTCMYVCTCKQKHICKQAHIQIYTYICKYIHIETYIFTFYLEIIINTQEDTKIILRCPVYPSPGHPASPRGNILQNYSPSPTLREGHWHNVMNEATDLAQIAPDALIFFLKDFNSSYISCLSQIL